MWYDNYLDYSRVNEVKQGKAYKRYIKAVRMPLIIGACCMIPVFIFDGVLQWVFFGGMILSSLVYLVRNAKDLNAKDWKCPYCNKDLPMDFSDNTSTPVLLHTCPYCKEDLTK